jgi:hypothetical protein
MHRIFVAAAPDKVSVGPCLVDLSARAKGDSVLGKE